MDRRVKERLIGASILVVLVVLIVPELLSGPKRSAAPSAPLIPVASGATEPVRNVTVDLATSKAPADDAAGAASAAGAPAAGTPAAGSPARGTPAAGTPAAGAPPLPGDSAAGTMPGAAPSGAERRGGEAGTSGGSPSITTLKAQPPSSSTPERAAAGSPPRAVPPVAGAATAAVAAAAGMAAAGGPAAAAASTGDVSHHAWAVQLGSFVSKNHAELLVRRLRGDPGRVYVSSTGSGRSLRFRVRVGPLSDRAAAERTLSRLQKEGHTGTLVAP